jgi:hypothetical protein
MLLAVLLYGYCTGVRSSRQIERRCTEDIAFRVLAGNSRPDHVTIARFRVRHEQALAGLLVQSLKLCAAAGMVRLGLLALDGTKIQANAATAANRTHAHLEAQVAELLSLAAEADRADRTRRAVQGWFGARPAGWLAGVGTVALDPWREYASALVTLLGHATVVVDHFHAIRLANAVVDQVRRRVQQATLGHRATSRTRCTASASCCWPLKSNSPSGDGCGCGPAWQLEIPPVRSPRPGKAKNSTGRLCRRRHLSGPRRGGALLPLGGRRPGQARRAWLPQLRQLPVAAAFALQHHLAESVGPQDCECVPHA